jgi:hypothetical protein
MVPRHVAHEEDLRWLEPLARQNQLDLPGLAEPGLVADAVVEPPLEAAAAE